MSRRPPEIEAADAFLDRLAAMDLQAAQHTHGLLLDATDPDDVAKLALAYARTSRCVRQTIGLHSKLQVDRRKAAREQMQHDAWAAAKAATGVDPWPAPDPHEYAVATRFDEMHDAVGRVIAATAGSDRARHTELAHRFDFEADDWVTEPDYLDYDVDALVQHACHVLDMPFELGDAWRDLPRPTFRPDPAPKTAPRPAIVHWPPVDLEYDDEDDEAPHDEAGPAPPVADSA